MNRSFIIALLVAPAFAQPYSQQDCVAKPCSAATNFSADLLGTPDNRPDTWGTAEAVTKTVTFRPPEGFRVRILRVYGDFLAWPLGVVPAGRFAGVLLGLSSTGPEASKHLDWGEDKTFLYVQHATDGKPARMAFDYDTSAGGLLKRDNKLVVKLSVWLNDCGLKVHMEPSMVLVFQYERDTEPVRD